MSYVPPHLRPGYVPPHLRPGYVAPVVKKGVRFISDVSNNSDVKADNGTRYAPRSPVANPKKRTLKVSKSVSSPNKTPIVKPSTRIRNWAPKFRNLVLSRRVGETEGKGEDKGKGNDTRKQKQKTRKQKQKTRKNKTRKHTHKKSIAK